jgi:pilus assembly protein TadC
MKNLMAYIAYTAGVIFILLGLAILFTNLFPAHLPSQLKVTMGIVLFLYGAFRILSTMFKVKRRIKDEESN